LIKSRKSISYQLFYCTYSSSQMFQQLLVSAENGLGISHHGNGAKCPFPFQTQPLFLHSFSNSVLLHARHRMRLCVRLLMAAREHHSPPAETQTTYPCLIAAWYLCHWQRRPLCSRNVYQHCRPGGHPELQRSMYNTYKSTHMGIMGNVGGPSGYYRSPLVCRSRMP